MHFLLFDKQPLAFVYRFKRKWLPDHGRKQRPYDELKIKELVFSGKQIILNESTNLTGAINELYTMSRRVVSKKIPISQLSATGNEEIPLPRTLRREWQR